MVENEKLFADTACNRANGQVDRFAFLTKRHFHIETLKLLISELVEFDKRILRVLYLHYIGF